MNAREEEVTWVERYLVRAFPAWSRKIKKKSGGSRWGTGMKASLLLAPPVRTTPLPFSRFINGLTTFPRTLPKISRTSKPHFYPPPRRRRSVVFSPLAMASSAPQSSQVGFLLAPRMSCFWFVFDYFNQSYQSGSSILCINFCEQLGKLFLFSFLND